MKRGNFGVGLFHDEVIGSTWLGVLQIDADGKIKPVVSQEGDDFILGYGYGLKIRKDFLFEEVFDELLVERFYVSVLIEYDMVLRRAGSIFCS